MAEGIRVEFSRESMQLLLATAKAAGPTIKRKIYKGLREAAEPAAQAARDEVLNVLPGKAEQRSVIGRALLGSKKGISRQSTGLRAGIARGLTIGVRSSGKSAGVRISSSAKYLNESQRAAEMNRVWNRPNFKHPVFGGKKQIPQHGNPWFYDPIRSKEPVFREALLRAMQNAADELERQK